MKLKQALLIAVSFFIVAIASWELYWRNQGTYINLDDDNELWAIHRSRVESADKNDIVIIGSSRAYFDLQLDVWERTSGTRPIQLAIEGTSPQYLFDDLVNNSNFNGTIVVGVTEGLFFSTLFPEAPPNQESTARVKYLKDRTYAQRLNHKLSLPFQNTLAFVSATEGTDAIKLKGLLKKIKIGNRVPNPMPPFHIFANVDASRNLRMTERCATDTSFARTVKNVWMFFAEGAKKFPPEKEATMNFFLKNLEKFKARGGKVILVRCPSTGKVRDLEKKVFPREQFWNELVEKSDVPAYHFEDYQQLKDLDCPEWSHLSGEGADYFTEELVKLLIKDNVIQPTKTN